MPGPGIDSAALEIRGLTKRYGARLALAGLDLRVPRGSITALLGPNGAGKSSTVEICCGLRTADAGTLQVLGRDPRREAAQLRPRIGVMLQSGGVYPGANAAEMLRHVARLHANPLDPVELLREVGLADTGRTTYRRLSGGQKQLLALALAVVGRPELVFLDEPTAGLDPHARRDTWQLIRRLKADGVTVVLATHLMDEAEALCDLVHIVHEGRSVASGTPAQLTEGYSGVLKFRAPAGLPLTELLAALPNGCSAAEETPGVYRVEGGIGPGELATVTAWCANRNVMPEILETGRRSLEDVFLELTARGEQ